MCERLAGLVSQSTSPSALPGYCYAKRRVDSHSLARSVSLPSARTRHRGAGRTSMTREHWTIAPHDTRVDAVERVDAASVERSHLRDEYEDAKGASTELRAGV